MNRTDVGLGGLGARGAGESRRHEGRGPAVQDWWPIVGGVTN